MNANVQHTYEVIILVHIFEQTKSNAFAENTFHFLTEEVTLHICE